MQKSVVRKEKEIADIDDILKRIKEEEEEAFSQFYFKYSRYIYYVARKYTNSKQDCEDLVQSSFILIFKKIEALQDSRSILSWMGKVVATAYRSKVIYENRIKRKAEIWHEDISEMKNLFDEKSPSLEEIIVNNEKSEAINNLVDQLPPKQRRAIFMFYFQEFSTREISEIEMCSEESVRNALFKARGTLKKKILKGREKDIINPALPVSLENDFSKFHIPAERAKNLWEERLEAIL